MALLVDFGITGQHSPTTTSIQFVRENSPSVFLHSIILQDVILSHPYVVKNKKQNKKTSNKNTAWLLHLESVSEASKKFFLLYPADNKAFCLHKKVCCSR